MEAPSAAASCCLKSIVRCAQIPEDEDAELTQEEMEALEEDMQSDFEVAEMIK